MTRASDALETAIWNDVLGGGAHPVTWPTTYYLGCASTDAGELEAGTLTNELAVSFGYAREAITFRNGDGSALPITGSTVENAATITLAASGGTWAEVNYMFVIDTSSGAGTFGVMLWTPVDAFTLGDGDSVVFDPGDIVFTIS